MTLSTKVRVAIATVGMPACCHPELAPTIVPSPSRATPDKNLWLGPFNPVARAQAQLIAEGYGPWGAPDLANVHIALSDIGFFGDILLERKGSASLDAVAICDGARHGEPGHNIVLFPYIRAGALAETSIPVFVDETGEARVSGGGEMPSAAYKYPELGCTSVEKPKPQLRSRSTSVGSMPVPDMLRAQGFMLDLPADPAAMQFTSSEHELSLREIVTGRRGLVDSIPTFVCPSVGEMGEPGEFYVFAIIRGPKAHTFGKLMFHPAGRTYLVPREEEVPLSNPPSGLGTCSRVQQEL